MTSPSGPTRSPLASPVHLAGILLVASAGATLLSAFTPVGATVANLGVAAPALVLLPGAFFGTVRRVPRAMAVTMAVVLALYAGIPAVVGASLESASRALVILMYVVLFIFLFAGFRWDDFSLGTLWGWGLAAVLLYLLAANVAAPDIVSSIGNPIFRRYRAIAGPNLHAVLSAIGCMLTVGLLQQRLTRARRLLLCGALLYCALNLYVTGSRASYLAILVFLGLMALYRGRRAALTLAVTGLAAGGLVLWRVVGIERVRAALRLGQAGIRTRIRANLHGLELMEQNAGLPYGYGRVAEVVTRGPLDNAYLWIGLETGALGLLGVVAFVAATLLVGHRVVRRCERASGAWRRAVVAVATAAGLATHGFFETYLFVGIEAGALLFLMTSAYLFARYRPAAEGNAAGEPAPAAGTA